MATSDSERIAIQANNSARMAAHLMFMSEIAQAVESFDRQKIDADKRYADTLSNIHATLSANVVTAQRRLNAALDTLEHALDESEDYE